MEDIIGTNRQVKFILHLHPATRNDDHLLWIMLLEEFHEDKLVGVDSALVGKTWVLPLNLSTLKTVPSLASVIRYRAHIQSQNGVDGAKYLPTSKTVADRRFKAQADIKKSLGYHSTATDRASEHHP